MRRALTVVLLLTLMAAFGFGVNRFLESRRVSIATITQVTKPSQTKPVFALPGTLYVAQHGDIFSLTNGRFTDLKLPSKGTWMQPAIVPGSPDIVAVLRTAAYSDVYLLGSTGTVLEQLSNNATKSKTIQLNHWMFWPRVGADGKTLYVSYDSPKTTQSYRVDFAIWKGLLSNGKTATRELTVPWNYTGGDVDPTPLSDGTVLFAKYQVGGGNVYSQVALQKTPLAAPIYLTDATADCGQPALSPDASEVAMVCAGGTGLQSTRLEVATLTGAKLGVPQVLVDNCLCAAPAWAPDGSGLVYYAANDAAGHFQLWWIAGAGTALQKAPRQVTDDLDFDALSPPAWTGPAGTPTAIPTATPKPSPR
jgi:hypothetical protein